MKKLLAFTILAAFACAGALMADSSCWSDDFDFDGNEITEKAILLQPTDNLAYSSAMAEGEPKSLTITATDTADPEVTANIFIYDSAKPVEGTTVWNYKTGEYKDLPTDDTYLLTETIVSDTETKVLTRKVNILPEPAAFLLLGLVAVFFLRKRAKSLVAVLALIALGAQAESSVTDVSCLQMWPFDRCVIINYTVESDSVAPLAVKFSGSFDNGETIFELGEEGTISKDGADGTLLGAGKYKTFWMPDESFYKTQPRKMKINVEVSESVVPPSEDTYMVVDLTNGETSFLSDVPPGGWSDTYKTVKLVLRKVKAGKFTMGSPEDELGRREDEVQHEVTLTKDFYIGVFETTQKQYELITSTNASYYVGETRPAEDVDYYAIRGAGKGKGWPANSEVDEDSFMGKLRAKTGADFDLPTEAQWEFACRAGTTTSWNNGSNITNIYRDGNMNKLGRYDYNRDDGKGGYTQHTVVGSYLPNAWGLYDMHGNVWEWCLDWYGDYAGDETDPVGQTTGRYRVRRGAAYDYDAENCRSASRMREDPSEEDERYGFRVALTINEEKYMVVDLESGDISYLGDVPEGGWTDEYKTTKMVLRKVEAGKFTMGSPEDELGRYKDEVQHDVTLTKDFYIAVFQTTQKQYETIIGSNPSEYTGDLRPVDSVPYNTIRGTEKGKGWPTNGEVDEDSFFGKFRAKTGADFDLPTEAQWEFACRAGTTTALNNGTNLTNDDEDENVNKLGRYEYNHSDGKGGYTQHTTVGSYLPNAWGLYDMHGNVLEWCLDWWDDSESWSSDPVTDPAGATTGTYRILRGGSYYGSACNCRSAVRFNGIPSRVNSRYGFRVVLSP